MLKKIFLFLILFLLYSISSALISLPPLYLQGVPHLEYNEINIFKLQKGFSISRDNALFLANFNPLTTKEVDYDNRLVKLTYRFNDEDNIYPPIYLSLDRYLENNFTGIFHFFLETKSKDLLKQDDRTEGQGLIPEIVIKLPPAARTKVVDTIFGVKDGQAGRLSLDGSQKLTFSGSSTKRKNMTQYENDNESKQFDLQMRQDLNLRLRGTIGDKIHVSVDQHSSSEDEILPEPGDIKINYEGYDDEVVKTIDAGNISLSLTGSSFSSPASSEGLFGVRSEMEFGSLKLKTFIAKNETKKSTQKWTGNTQADSSDVKTKDYVMRTHYFIADPYLLYELYTEVDIVSDGLPEGWANNAIKTASDGSWYISNSGQNLLPQEGTIHLFLDNTNASEVIGKTDGIEIDHPEKVYLFEPLIEGTDYSVDYDSGIIIMNMNIDKKYTIGIAYTQHDGTVIGDYTSSPVEVKLLRKSNQDYETVSDQPYWKLQVRNIYYSSKMEGVKNDGFGIDVFNLNADNTKNFFVPDSIDTGSMGRITYNDYLRLDSNGDVKINGDDATINLSSGHVIFPFIEPFNPLGEPIIYQEDISNIGYEDFFIYMGIKGKIGRDIIELGQMGLLPGSVVIKIGPKSNQRTLKENTDYIVDYDFGTITMLTAEGKDAEVEIEISYQFKPLFSVESKTLMGLRADMQFNENLEIGGTFLYQAEKVSEERPKIGSENRSIILADFDGRIEYEAPFLTKIVDWLPLIKTDEDSRMSLNGEFAMSLPRIWGNPKQSDIKEAYVDDMESILESFPLGVTRKSWVYGSKPYDINFGKAAINWYNPTNILAREVYDNLTAEEEKEKISVLTCKIKPPQIGNPGFENKYWAGLMKYVGNQLDFSKKKYFEVLVKVDDNYSTDVVMHLDLGDINEDFYTEYGGEGVLNMEDGLYGGDKDGRLDGEEDVGLDMIRNGDPGDDPFDDFNNDKDSLGDYPNINSTERNSDLDTEDLDNNGSLNDLDVYLEYSLSLQDTSSSYLQSEFNGWKLYRIPLNDADNYRIVSNEGGRYPNLDKISYARIWFEVTDISKVQMVNLDLVGNKWEEAAIKDEENNYISPFELESNGETMLVGLADNQKDPHYTPAPGTLIKKSGEITLEQSLIIDYENLQPDHVGIAFQDFQESYNLLGYNKIRFWIYPEKPANSGGISDLEHDLIIRLGADSLLYYEIIYPQTALDYADKMSSSGWKSIEIDFSDLTFLKTRAGVSDSIHVEGDYSWYQKGDYKIGMLEKNGQQPTLSVIKQIALGIRAIDEFTGRIYFDDIRVVDPYEDVGYAASTSFHTSFADFSTLDISLNWQTDNFQNSTTRSGTYSTSSKETTSLTINNRYNLHKFLPAEWGFSLPLALSRNQSLGIPRFKSNSDILREDLTEEEKERETDKTLSYRADFSYGMNKTPKSKILAYTLKNTSIRNVYAEYSKTLKATNADTTFKYGATHNYKLDLPVEKLGIKLFGKKQEYKFYFFPNSFDNTITYLAEFPRRWRWETYADTIPHWTWASGTNDIKTLSTDSFIKYDIFSDIQSTYKLTTKRDLTLKSEWDKFPLGQEKNRTQTVTLGYDPNHLDKIFTFRVDTDVQYNDEHKLLSQSGDETEDKFEYEGGVSRDISGAITLKNKELLSGWLAKIEAAKSEDEQSQDQENRNSQDNEDPPDEDEMENNLRYPDPEGKDEESIPENDPDYPDPEGEDKESVPINDPPEFKPDNPDEEKEDIEDNENDDENFESDEQEERSGNDSPPDEEQQDQQDQEDTEKTGKKKSINIFKTSLKLISRLDNISFNYNNDYGTTYEKREDRPEFLYQLGFPHILHEDFVHPDSSDIRMKEVGYSYDISSGYPILNNLTTTFKYSKDLSKRYASASNMTITTVFPNVTVTLTEFEKIIKASSILTSSRLSSNYVYTHKLSGVIDWDDPTSEDKSYTMQPLLSWNGNWIHDIVSSISLGYSNSEKTTFYAQYNSVNKSITQSISTNISWSFSAAKGIKIPFLKKKFKINNKLTADMRVNLERTYSTTEQIWLESGAGENTKNTNTNKVHLTLSPGASYEFSKNINGGLTSSYDRTNDKKADSTISIFSLSLWVEITF